MPAVFCSRSQKGATLVELIMTIVIISVAIAGVVGAFSLIVGRSADPLNQTRAVALSQRYMDEILFKKFDESSPVGGGQVDASDVACSAAEMDDGESRSGYDDVDDYDDVTDEIPSDYWASSNPEIGYEQYKVNISVTCVSDPLAELGVDVLSKRIDITVTDPSGNDYIFSAYRGNF